MVCADAARSGRDLAGVCAFREGDFVRFVVRLVVPNVRPMIAFVARQVVVQVHITVLLVMLWLKMM